MNTKTLGRAIAAALLVVFAAGMLFFHCGSAQEPASLRNVQEQTEEDLCVLSQPGGASSGNWLKRSDNPYSSLGVGMGLTLGWYEVDNDLSYTGENLPWRVLDIRDGKALLLCEIGIDCGKMHERNSDVTWEDCDLRSWLNDEFYKECFDRGDRQYIVKNWVDADENCEYDTDPGYDTWDRIFLLSAEEVLEYFPDEEDRICPASDYAVANGAYVNTRTDGSWWWLRTPGADDGTFASVNSDGTIDWEGCGPTGKRGVIRPALWLDIE